MEIKFKGKQVKTGKILYGDLIHNRGGVYIADDSIVNAEDIQGPTDFEVYPYSVCQFIGLYDKNHNEIFNGDVLRSDEYPYSWENEPDNYLIVINWDKEKCRYNAIMIKGSRANIFGMQQGNIIDNITDITQMEVIGNIYEEPYY